MVTLGLSVGRGATEPQSKRVKRCSPVSEQKNAEADVLVSTAGNNSIIVSGKKILFLSGSESVARLTLLYLVDWRGLAYSYLVTSIQEWNKSRLANGMQEVGLVRSTNEASNDRRGKGPT